MDSLNLVTITQEQNVFASVQTNDEKHTNRHPLRIDLLFFSQSHHQWIVFVMKLHLCFMASAIPNLLSELGPIVSLSEIIFSVFETLHDEHIIAVREEPVLDSCVLPEKCHRWNV